MKRAEGMLLVPLSSTAASALTQWVTSPWREIQPLGTFPLLLGGMLGIQQCTSNGGALAHGIYPIMSHKETCRPFTMAGRVGLSILYLRDTPVHPPNHRCAVRELKVSGHGISHGPRMDATRQRRTSWQGQAHQGVRGLSEGSQQAISV